MKKEGAFRYTYFSSKYFDTLQFYQKKLELDLMHSWDRSETDKGALFAAGKGLIEVLHAPSSTELENAGLDYRTPQGVFVCLQVWEIDQLFEKYKATGVPFKQDITNQEWGHRSFTVVEPNGLLLFFFEEQF